MELPGKADALTIFGPPLPWRNPIRRVSIWGRGPQSNVNVGKFHVSGALWESRPLPLFMQTLMCHNSSSVNTLCFFYPLRDTTPGKDPHYFLQSAPDKPQNSFIAHCETPSKNPGVLPGESAQRTLGFICTCLVLLLGVVWPLLHLVCWFKVSFSMAGLRISILGPKPWVNPPPSNGYHKGLL